MWEIEETDSKNIGIIINGKTKKIERIMIPEFDEELYDESVLNPDEFIIRYPKNPEIPLRSLEQVLLIGEKMKQLLNQALII